MTIGVSEDNGTQLSRRLRQVIWKHKSYFQPPKETGRVAVAIFRNGGFHQTIEVLPGRSQPREVIIPLQDLLPSLPPEIRADLYPLAENS